MNTASRPSYREALDDFFSARAKSAIEELVSRIKGRPFTMLEYNEVRKHFNLIESANQILKEIPLNAIIGSVSRPKDFSRNLYPLRNTDADRWARVKEMVENLSGLPPIEVYQVGQVYFIIDGHHRASVAREMGATHIEALVRQVITRVPLNPEDDLEDLILKSEYENFLAKTRLDKLRPGAKLQATMIGVYPKLIEYISVHQYVLEKQKKTGVSFERAAIDWYDRIYMPVVKLIQTRNTIHFFSDRTETDLFFYITEYRLRSERELGWKVTPRDAEENLTFNYARDIRHRFNRFQKKLIDLLLPEPLEPAIPPGFWRQHRKAAEENMPNLFDTILVALPGTKESWNALDAALFIANNEHASVSGLTVVSSDAEKAAPMISQFQKKFIESCQRAAVEGRMAVEVGRVPNVVYERSFWVDLVVIPLAYPPPSKPILRLSSGIRSLIRRCATPVLFVPPQAPNKILSVLVAYGGGRLADEALYMAAYLCIRFKIELTVITISERGKDAGQLHQRACLYLQGMGINRVTYIEEQGDAALVILNCCQSNHCDLILMGGYEGGFFKELFVGSTVDQILRNTNRMVMICR